MWGNQGGGVVNGCRFSVQLSSASQSHFLSGICLESVKTKKGVGGWWGSHASLLQPIYEVAHRTLKLLSGTVPIFESLSLVNHRLHSVCILPFQGMPFVAWGTILDILRFSVPEKEWNTDNSLSSLMHLIFFFCSKSHIPVYMRLGHRSV